MSSAIEGGAVGTADDTPTRPTNVLIVGVGGQGVILVSKILARICQLHDLQIKQSEVHGMAKRGGSVFSHVRFGHAVWAPTIAVGEADVLIALEWAEGLRWLHYLNPDSGTFIADTKRIVPPFGCTDRRRGAKLAYPNTEIADVVGMVPNTFALDAEDMARELGNPRVANTLLLGVLATVLEFPIEEWHRVLAEFVPAKTVDANRLAFEAGRDWTQKVRDITTPRTCEPQTSILPVETSAGEVSLEIIEAWCKGCDICVKMCPELCLKLDHRSVVELTDPSACTGCHICEWLCPDFAIRVHINQPSLSVIP